MKRLTSERMNGIKTGYWSAAKKEELVQALAVYENTGLTPEEIKALKANKNPCWIPVEERLPKSGKAVLATIRHSAWTSDADSDWVPEEGKIYHPESCGVYKAEYVGDGLWQYADDDNEWIYCDAVEKENKDPWMVYDTVIAWMPLPEPYRVEE